MNKFNGPDVFWGEQKRNVYKDVKGHKLSDDYIEEEFVADAIGKMINDFDLANDIALRLDHPTLYAMKRAVDRVAGLFAPFPPKRTDKYPYRKGGSERV